MSTHSIDDELQDNDPTDELPILTDVILGDDGEGTAAMPATTTEAEDTGRFQTMRADAHSSPDGDSAAAVRLQKDLDARNERLSTLETELARLQQRWSDTEAALSERDAELSQLRSELTDRETANTEQSASLEESRAELQAHKTTIAELTATLELERDRAAALERGSGDLERQIDGLESKIAQIETERDAARADSKQEFDQTTVDRLRDEVAALSQHIENRNVVWHEQAETLAAQAIRIQELEIEVAQRLERQREAERLAETEAASAHAAREKLGEALDSLKRNKRADEPPAVAQPSEPRPVSAEDHAAQLRHELAQTVLIQATQGDDAQTLGRLAELESAIMRLETQMESPGSEPDEVSPPESARLICLTAEEPTEYVLDKAGATIGRGGTCDIKIGTHYVSREHARITLADAGCYIEDLGSRNGVFVNAVKIERQDLETGDLITVGDTQFRYQTGGSR